MSESDVIIIGAGAAGMAAARELSSAGLRVVIVDARDRLGGRIFTSRIPDFPCPLELGAEFVHGRPPETFRIIRSGNLPVCDINDQHWQLSAGKLKSDDSWEQMQQVMGRLHQLGSRDMSFADFLDQFCGDVRPDAKEMAIGFVEGFNAADARRISCQWLIQSEKSSQQNDGDRIFRMPSGYDGILDWMRNGLDLEKSEILLSTAATAIRWRREHIKLDIKSIAGLTETLSARAALITIPSALLAADDASPGAIRFDPPLPDKRRAAASIAMGPVVRITLIFRAPFWESLKDDDAQDLTDLTFAHSLDQPMPTIWTLLPLRTTALVAWAGGPAADQLRGRGDQQVLSSAIRSISDMFRQPKNRIASLLDAHHWHDWQADPYSRGAYSYVPVGALDAPKILARVVEGTLFFAGEASCTDGRNGTVAGAIATGLRAAAEIVHRLRGG